MNILFTSVGNLAFPTVAECLKKSYPDCKIVGVDVRKNAHGLYFCDKKYIVDYRNAPSFLNEILNIIEKEDIDILFPLSTEDQDYFSKNKKVFKEKGIKVICSDYSSVKIVNNKYLLYNELKKHGLSNPMYVNIVTMDDVTPAISELGVPFVIKPHIGKGGSNLYIIANSPTDIRKDDLKFYISYAHLQQNLGQYISPGNVLLCEYLPGDEYSVDTLSKNGTFYYGIVRKRYSSYGGLALEAEVTKDDMILSLAKEIVETFKLSYINNIQFKCDRKGDPKVMEINPRIPGTLSLSIKAGADFITDSIRLANGQPITLPRKVHYGLKIIRFWSGVFVTPDDEKSIIDLRVNKNG